MTTTFLAIRNLFLQKERHFLISLAIIVVFSLITIVAGASYGSLEAIKIKAGRYFSGNVSITGYTRLLAGIADPAGIIAALRRISLPVRTIAERTVYQNSDAALFFNGETIRQRKLIGIDFDVEGPEFTSLVFVKGSWKALTTDEGRDGILISAPAARILGCSVGDDLTLYLTTDTGQYNTARLFVRGIFNETSLFGFVAYMRRGDLNRLLLRPPNAATDIAVYAKEGVDIERFSECIRLELKKNFSVFPRFFSREERDAVLVKGENDTEILSILSQNAQLAEIKQLMDALLAVTYFTLGLFIAIVMVGILNTYRVLVHERVKEIGTLRAIGMGRKQVRSLFLMEAALLALVSSFLGLLLGIFVFRLISLIDLSSIPAAGMFLEGGHLRFSLNLFVLATNTGIVVAAAVLAAWGPSRQAARIKPAEALRSI